LQELCDLVQAGTVRVFFETWMSGAAWTPRPSLSAPLPGLGSTSKSSRPRGHVQACTGPLDTWLAYEAPRLAVPTGCQFQDRSGPH
jgi:hypothetical protein